MSEKKENPVMSFIDTKLIPVSQRIADNKYIRCLAGGSMSLMAIILIGAVFNLLNSIGFEWYQNFIQGIGINYLFNLIYNACMNLMSVFIVYSVGFNSAKIFGHEELAFNNGFLAEVAFFILMPIGSYTAEGAFGATNFYAIDYLGSHGVFLALITGIVVTKINIFIVEKKITIKMPAGVPQNVSDSFTALIPGTVIVFLFAIINWLFTMTPWGNAEDAIYGLLQTPLSVLTGSLPAFMIAVILSQVLWFFGIHGSYTILPIFMPIWLGYLADNTAAQAAGEEIPYIFNCGMFDLTTIGGCGCTLGLVIVMFFFAKSKRYKTFSKVVLPCGLFNINEPLIYGFPLMLNAAMIIPFIVMPLVSLILGYAAIMLGLMPAPVGLVGVTSMPVFFGGIVQGSWKIGVFQIIITLISCVVYYPFFMAMDKQAVAEEKADEAAEQ